MTDDRESVDESTNPEGGRLASERQLAGVDEPAVAPGCRIPDYQLHHIALAVAGGQPAELIARATGIPLDRIKRTLDRPSVKLQQLIDDSRLQQNMGMLKLKLELHDMVDEAKQAIEATLKQEKDPRLRYEAAWDILAQAYDMDSPVRSKPQANGAGGVQAQFNLFTDPQFTKEFAVAAQRIEDQTSQLVESMPDFHGGPHFKLGVARTAIEDPDEPKADPRDADLTETPNDG